MKLEAETTMWLIILALIFSILFIVVAKEVNAHQRFFPDDNPFCPDPLPAPYWCSQLSTYYEHISGKPIGQCCNSWNLPPQPMAGHGHGNITQYPVRGTGHNCTRATAAVLAADDARESCPGGTVTFNFNLTEFSGIPTRACFVESHDNVNSSNRNGIYDVATVQGTCRRGNSRSKDFLEEDVEYFDEYDYIEELGLEY